MSKKPATDRRTTRRRKAVSRLLSAVDRALAAAQEVRAARDELLRVAETREGTR